MAEKELKYDGYKNVLNRVAYKLIKSKATYKHSDKYTIDKKTKTHSQIIEIIKKNGTNYKKDEYITRFMEDVIAKTDSSKLPDYVVGASGATKYKRAYYIDMAKRVSAFRKKNNRNPKKVKAKYDKITNNCKNPYTSSPHYTESGCNKLGQCTAYFCGPHCIHQGFKKVGKTSISEAQLASWAGTTSSGSDHDGLNTAIKKAANKLDFDVEINWYYFSDLGKTVDERFANFGKMICKSNVFGFFHIGYQGSGESKKGQIFGHYEMADQIDIKNKKIRILNSLGNKCGSTAYCGHIQWRSFDLHNHYINNKKGVKSVCIVKLKKR